MNVKKKGISFLLMAIVIAVLLPSGALETTVYAESLGLTPISSWRYATHRASSGKQVDKVYQLAKAKASSSVAARLHDVMYDATYRPAVNGGSKWRSGWITSVYDKGLDTTVTFSGSQGCFSYANYISKYVRGSTGQRRLIPQDKPSAEDIRLGNYFNKRNTSAVIVHHCAAPAVNKLSCVLLDMYAENAYFSAVGKLNIAVIAQRHIKL